MITSAAEFAFQSPRAAYVHVPFCVHRCGYCDFTVIAGKDQLIPAYLATLEQELMSLGQPQPVDTLFLGGGTPTHLPPRDLETLLKLVRTWFDLSPGAEFSVEANPAGLDQERVDVLAAAGVNRVSLGVQAFDDATLSILERDHRRDDICQTYARLKRQISNLSLDLIFGVPGQSEDTWHDTVQSALALQPQHLSTYGLTYEKGTRFWTRRIKGELVPPGDDLEREMYGWVMDELPKYGFEQYEISSFAQPGFRCRHNQIYWTGQSYYGFGPGAARYINGRRESNHRSVTTWMHRIQNGLSPIGDSEELTAEDRARELIVLGLRRCEGINRAEFLAKTGIELEVLVGTELRHHLATGLLEETSAGQIRLTKAGRFVADGVIVDFL
jgi:oxygen-independent coproporphyrinogen-3 oxidase